MEGGWKKRWRMWKMEIILLIYIMRWFKPRQSCKHLLGVSVPLIAAFTT